MTWFSIPTTYADQRAAFSDADSAARWLAAQPQANAVAMLASLVAQIELFNACRVAPRERFETLEVLRQALFAVSGEGQRRYEHKALPLLPGEQLAFDQARRLWRACALAYLHCLRAGLDDDPAIAEHVATVAHRVLTCLRQEQMNCYLAGAELDADFWSVLHAVWAAAETLSITRQPVADRLLRETLESTVAGHYAMALLLHLARPYTLSRTQLAAVIRWFSRWREQAKVESTMPASGESSCALDLSSASPLIAPLRAAGVARWLVLGRVLRKMRERLRSLAKGESPESLKLGSGLSPAECVALLTALGDRLTHPEFGETLTAGDESLVLAAGLENAYHWLGGASLKDDVASSSFSSQLVVEQLAVFGHVVRAAEASSDSAGELWRLVKRDADELRLMRNAAAGGARLTLRSLLAVRLPAGQVLATVSCLCSRRDGSLCVSASLLAGKPAPLLAELRAKPSGQISRHPAILLTPERGAKSPDAPLLFLPAGLAGRALAIHFFDSRGQSLPGLALAECLAHSGESERWTVTG